MNSPEIACVNFFIKNVVILQFEISPGHGET